MLSAYFDDDEDNLQDVYGSSGGGGSGAGGGSYSGSGGGSYSGGVMTVENYHHHSNKDMG